MGATITPSKAESRRQLLLLVAVFSAFVIYLVAYRPFLSPLANALEVIVNLSCLAFLAMCLWAVDDDHTLLGVEVSVKNTGLAMHYLVILSVAAMVLRTVVVSLRTWFALPRAVHKAGAVVKEEVEVARAESRHNRRRKHRGKRAMTWEERKRWRRRHRKRRKRVKVHRAEQKQRERLGMPPPPPRDEPADDDDDAATIGGGSDSGSGEDSDDERREEVIKAKMAQHHEDEEQAAAIAVVMSNARVGETDGAGNAAAEQSNESAEDWLARRAAELEARTHRSDVSRRRAALLKSSTRAAAAQRRKKQQQRHKPPHAGSGNRHKKKKKGHQKKKKKGKPKRDQATPEDAAQQARKAAVAKLRAGGGSRPRRGSTASVGALLVRGAATKRDRNRMTGRRRRSLAGALAMGSTAIEVDVDGLKAFAAEHQRGRQNDARSQPAHGGRRRRRHRHRAVVHAARVAGMVATSANRDKHRRRKGRKKKHHHRSHRQTVDPTDAALQAFVAAHADTAGRHKHRHHHHHHKHRRAHVSRARRATVDARAAQAAPTTESAEDWLAQRVAKMETSSTPSVSSSSSRSSRMRGSRAPLRRSNTMLPPSQRWGGDGTTEHNEHMGAFGLQVDPAQHIEDEQERRPPSRLSATAPGDAPGSATARSSLRRSAAAAAASQSRERRNTQTSAFDWNAFGAALTCTGTNGDAPRERGSRRSARRVTVSPGKRSVPAASAPTDGANAAGAGNAAAPDRSPRRSSLASRHSVAAPLISAPDFERVFDAAERNAAAEVRGAVSAAVTYFPQALQAEWARAGISLQDHPEVFGFPRQPATVGASPATGGNGGGPKRRGAVALRGAEERKRQRQLQRKATRHNLSSERGGTADPAAELAAKMEEARRAQQGMPRRSISETHRSARRVEEAKSKG